MAMEWVSVCLAVVAFGLLSTTDAQIYSKPQAPKYTPVVTQQRPQQATKPIYPQQTAPVPLPPQAPKLTLQLPEQRPQQAAKPTYHQQFPVPPQQSQLPKYPSQQQDQRPHQGQTKPQYQVGQKANQNQQNTKKPSGEPFHTCEVEALDKIQCGHDSMSGQECEHINCCYDGRMCYYGKAVTVQCTKDGQIIVVVARDATLPNLDLESIALLGIGPSCVPVGSTSAFAIYQFRTTECGTVLMEQPGVIIYENRMLSSYEVGVGKLGSVTRDSSYDLLFQCKYIGTSIEVLVVEVNLVPPPQPVAAPGPLRVELRLGNGICNVKGCVEEDVVFASFYTEFDYPVVKTLRDPVYVDIFMLERTDPNIVLSVEHCWATTDANPYSLPRWDLLVNGCPYVDDRYQTRLIPVGPASANVLFPTHHRRFVFKMFTFVEQTTLVPRREKVHIHCGTAVCQPTTTSGCEPRCFRKKRHATAVQKLRPETTIVTSPPIMMVTDNLPSE